MEITASYNADLVAMLKNQLIQSKLQFFLNPSDFKRYL